MRHFFWATLYIYFEAEYDKTLNIKNYYHHHHLSLMTVKS